MRNLLQKTLGNAWLQLQQQLHANQRLRWMIWGIAYIFILYFALTLSEWRQDHNQNIAQLQRTSLKLDQLKTQTQWPERWEQEKASAEVLRAKLWRAESASLAEADLQNYVRRLLNDHNAQNIRLRLAPTETVQLAGEPLLKVTADVTGVIDVAQIDHLTKAMADNAKSIVIERFSYSPQRAGQISMLMTAYFLVSSTERTAEQKEPQNAKP